MEDNAMTTVAKARQAIVQLDIIDQAIENAQSVSEVKVVHDKIEVLRLYAQKQGLGLEQGNDLAERRLVTERKAGILLKKMGFGEHGGDRKSSDAMSLDFLSDLGVTKKQSSRWQLEASVPEKDYQRYVAETRAKPEELTSAGLLRLAKKLKRKREKEAPPLPSLKYRILYADPPWAYRDAGVVTETDSYGRAERHYSTMTIEELCEMGPGVKEITREDAVLFLWTTSPLLEECFSVIEAWGFDYKASFVWDKIGHNYGHYNSVRHELLLICTRGSCLPDESKLFDSVQSIEKSRRHSEKPEEFRQIIDSLYTRGKRIELFAREATSGWDSWGDEVGKFSELS